MDNLVYRNGMYTINDGGNFQITEKLTPKKSYLLNYNDVYDYYFLTDAESLQLPKDIFGDKSYLNRFLVKYEKQDKNLGILLTGIKGDGKSVDAKLLALNSDQPIIIINAGYKCQKFLEFLSNPVFNNCTIFIDEYEKLYEANIDSRDNTNSTVNILKLLDGYSNNKNLFIFTSNSINISKYLLNRPSRLRYVKEYGGIDNSTLVDIVNFYIKDKTNAEYVIQYLKSFPLLTIDITRELLTEVVDLEITIEEALEHFNFKPKYKTYNVQAFIFSDENCTKLLNKSTLYHDRGATEILGTITNSSIYSTQAEILRFFETKEDIEFNLNISEKALDLIKKEINDTLSNFQVTEARNILNKDVYVRYVFTPSDMSSYLKAF